MSWQDEVLKEAAGGEKAQAVTTEILVGNPAKINRMGKSRRTPCKGGCGTKVWGDYCRKCRRKTTRARRKTRRKGH